MAELIIMPKLGFNMSIGKLVKWYKKEGEKIKKGEAFFSIETDKTNMDIEATSDGFVRKLFIEEGEQVEVTLPIAIVGLEDESIGDMAKEALMKLGKTASSTSQSGEGVQIKPAVSAPGILPTPGADTMDFDIVVMGGGPGGYVAAIKAAQMGKRTCIIEKENFGGVCLNKGCIPTKTLLRSVEALKEVKESSTFGVVNVDVANAKLDLSKVQERKNNVIKQLVGGVGGLLKANGVTIINGLATLVDKNTIQIGEKVITSDYIIIATGSEVKSIPIPISPDTQVLTSTEALDLNEKPESIAIIGGGVIGIEFAYFMANIGVKVSVIEFLDRILPMVDEEITIQVEKMLKDMGVTIHTSSKVKEIKGTKTVFEKDGKDQSIDTEKVLMAVGRVPYYEGLNIENIGIQTERGAIITDNSLKTNIDNIYAIGDVNGKAMLAHVASMEGIVAVENICGHATFMDYEKIPSAIYTQPEIACVGLTEKQAKEKYGEIKVGKFPLVANGKAKVAGEEKGLIKVIIEPKYNEIVGVHMYCIHATDMIAEAVVAMKLEGTAEEVATSIHPHPTVSEIVHEAFHGAIDKTIHFI